MPGGDSTLVLVAADTDHVLSLPATSTTSTNVLSLPTKQLLSTTQIKDECDISESVYNESKRSK